MINLEVTERELADCKLSWARAKGKDRDLLATKIRALEELIDKAKAWEKGE